MNLPSPGGSTKKELTEQQKWYYDALGELRRAAWESIDHRRPFEWKVCLAIWTALAVFVGSVVTARLAIASWSLLVVTTVAGLLIVWLHYRFIWGIRSAHNFDKATEGYFRDEMHNFLQIELPKEITDELKRILEVRDIKSIRRFLAHWNSGFQVGITFVLVVCCVVAVFAQHEQKAKEGREAPFEFKVLEVRGSSNSKELERYLNNVAKEGWRLVSISADRSDGTNVQSRLIMERRKESNSNP